MKKLTNFLVAGALAFALAPAFAFSLAAKEKPLQVIHADNGLEIVSVGGTPVEPEPSSGPTEGSFPMGKVGVSYSALLVAEGGSGSYTWSVLWGTLPEGISLNTDTGLVSGTPTEIRTGWITIKAVDKTNPGLSDSANLNFIIYDDTYVPSIQTESLPNAVVDDYYNQAIVSSGSSLDDINYSITSGSLPTGLELGKQGRWNGIVSGTPTQAGTYTFTIKAENMFGSDSKTYTIVVDEEMTISYPEGRYYLGDTVQFTTSIGYENTEWTIENNTSSKTTISSGGLLKIGEDETASFIRVYGTSKTNESNYATIDFEFTNKVAYSIAVQGGSSTDSSENPISKAAEGEDVYLHAPEVDGKAFTHWSVVDGSAPVTFWRDDVVDTFFEMPAGNVIVKANYNTIVTSVSATFDAPVNGNHIDQSVDSGDISYNVTLIGVWHNGNPVDLEETVYVTGDVYTFMVKFEATTGYQLAGRYDLTVTINGQAIGDSYNPSYQAWYIDLTAASDEDPFYSISVTNGSASQTSSKAGETITITANTPAVGKMFDKWVSSDVTFANKFATSTTFVMPGKAVAIEATYKDAPISYGITVNNGTSSVSEATSGTTVTITANEPASGYQFDKWTSVDVTFTNENSATTTFVMPEKAVTITATYKVIEVKTLSSITVSGQKTEFKVGEKFTFGGTVTAYYSDSTSSNVTSKATFTGYDLNTVGTQTVTVTYTENEVTKTTTYQITVSGAPVTPSASKGGLSGGAIAGIIIASVLVAGVGGFAVFWFVIKKKTWADLIAVFKKK